MPTLPCGHEVSDANQVHYCSYLRVPELIALQPRKEELKHHDELLFIITHQVFELWFKLILHEIGAAIQLLDADNPGYATWLMRRVNQVVRLLIEQIHMTETMAPQDFFAFRAALSPASGTESLQYREIEIRSGLRDTARYRPALEVAPGPPGTESPQTRVLTASLAAAWEQPSLHDAFMGLLRRRGVTVAQIYAPLDRSRHHDLFLLAETLLEYDELFNLWRTHHRAMVERALSGATKGTGHTTGVRYLDRTLTYPHFFPELWDARATLWQQMGEQPASDAGA
ncbi:MAG TPA: tryptophan 2,3-dioxygenase family protein [Roseiflexaceae bacterium]|nr:tryptophan 2,3-dioxygenase family protein [Roseiflexaceae bacterium]